MRGNWYIVERDSTDGHLPSVLTCCARITSGPKREAWEDLKKVLHFVYD